MGDVVLGEIGAQGQAPRTLIVDAVNTASRLEGVTKEYQVQVFISDPLLKAAGIVIPEQHMTDLVLRGVAAPLPALPIHLDVNLMDHLDALQVKTAVNAT